MKFKGKTLKTDIKFVESGGRKQDAIDVIMAAARVFEKKYLTSWTGGVTAIRTSTSDLKLDNTERILYDDDLTFYLETNDGIREMNDDNFVAGTAITASTYNAANAEANSVLHSMADPNQGYLVKGAFAFSKPAVWMRVGAVAPAHFTMMSNATYTSWSNQIGVLTGDISEANYVAIIEKSAGNWGYARILRVNDSNIELSNMAAWASNQMSTSNYDNLIIAEDYYAQNTGQKMYVDGTVLKTGKDGTLAFDKKTDLYKHIKGIVEVSRERNK